jgi:hypothetical protein
MDKLFIDGQEVEGLSRDKLIEGVLYTREDGLRVVLKEDGKWVRLDSLRKVKRIGSKLYEEVLQQATEAAQGLYTNIDFDKVEKDNKKDEIVGAVRDTLMSDRQNPLKDDDAIKIADDQYAAIKAERAAENGTGGDTQKAQEVLKTYGTEQEDSSSLKESLRESLTDALKDELGGVTIDELWDDEDSIEFEPDPETVKRVDDLIGDNDLTQEDEDWAQDFVVGFEDPNYKNPTPEMEEDAIQSIFDQLYSNENIEEIQDQVKYVLDNWEASPEEAEDIVVAAYERFLDKQIESKEIFKVTADEVDDAYEEEIDSYEGPDLLEHLKDTFEIPEEKATEIVRESRGSVPRAIILMSEYTRLHLC